MLDVLMGRGAKVTGKTSPRKVTDLRFLLPSMASSNFSQNICNVTYEDSKILLITMYSTVCILGFPTNCFTAWFSLLQVLQGNVLAIYLLCLAICEIFYVATLPFWIVYIQNGHEWKMGFLTCKIIAFVFFCNIYVSILFLCCISCDRFIAVTYALESRGFRNLKTAVFISITIFLIVGVVHYPVFETKENKTCFETLPVNSQIASYYYSRFVVGFAIPLSIIIFTNYKIFRSIKTSTSLSAHQKAKVKYLSISIVSIFLVCFAPYHLVLLIKAAIFSYYEEERKVCPWEVRMYTPSVICLCLCTFNSIADPIIYVLASEKGRKELSRFHKGWKQWSSKTDNLKSSKDMEELTPEPVNCYQLSDTPRSGVVQPDCETLCF
ncbi:probable G-protein coupled receptor 132 isoform X2 [Dromiciops gliroides]|uniref:probable G-protein coupled receptor 132 isoform X2 n=1 Tax=Dromiciops gliroides TaxID=33562 RepID=UPI001CC51CDC|nr:probable G-protein coupled receptor 132 isoform X2 [Dromiciops gliroides]